MQNNSVIPLGARILSMVIDLLFVGLVGAFLYFLFSPYDPKSNLNDSRMELNRIFFIAVVYSLYFCKDVFFGRSLGKWLFNLRVVNSRSNKIASPIRCVCRNFFAMLWFVEVVLIFRDPARRLGDFVAKTKLVFGKFEASSVTRISIIQIAISIALSFLLSFGVVFLVMYF